MDNFKIKRNFDVRCTFCRSKKVVKKGRQKTKFGYIQLFYCKNCGRKFTGRKLKNKTYGPKIITNAITYYNLGNTLQESAKLVNRRFKVKISKSSVHTWIKEFRNICTYHKIREKILKEYGKDILVSRNFVHNDLSYNFKYHKPKLEMCGFPSLISYIKKFDKGCPEFFDSIENRCSKFKLNLKIKKEGNHNLACKLAKLALKSCSKPKERHPTVENFMLINDSSTIACEVPIWFWEKNLNLGISGHIDILQVRNGLIYIVDFKPNARRENEQKVASQLYFYASGLSFRTSIPLSKFRCAWFDNSVYFEFAPKDAKVRFSNSKWRSNPVRSDFIPKNKSFRERSRSLEERNLGRGAKDETLTSYFLQPPILNALLNPLFESLI